jgi:hypothetical protein
MTANGAYSPETAFFATSGGRSFIQVFPIAKSMRMGYVDAIRISLGALIAEVVVVYVSMLACSTTADCRYQ